MLEIYQMAGHLIRRLHQISVSVFTERTVQAGFDLTSVQFAALSAIDANPAIDQATLAGAIAYDRVTIGKVIDRLEKKGYIKRTVSPHDRRARELHITDDGCRILGEILPIVREVQEDILSGLNDGERHEFIRLLQKVTESGNSKSRAPLQAPL